MKAFEREIKTEFWKFICLQECSVYYTKNIQCYSAL